MNQINVKINKYASQVNVVDTGNLNSRILKSILYTFGLLALGYVFILGNMITNILERRSLEAEARDLTNTISTLELTYLEKGSAIDLDYSHSLGFQDAHAYYATRQSIDTVKLAKNVR